MDFSLKLFPFQKDGAEFLAARRCAMLGWEMGTGKTPTAVRACVKVGAKRVLVFCPLIATGVWEKHFQDWSYYPDIRVSKLAEPFPSEFARGSGVRIIPYSQVSIGASVLDAVRGFANWDVVILDECHYLKSSGAKRTQTIYGSRIDLHGSPLFDAKHIWALSGTPILNSANEFWTHLHALAPDKIRFNTLGPMTERVFTDRYCVVRPTTYGFKIMGSRNQEELSRRVRGFMSRKRATDVLKDLPPLRVVEYPLPADTPIPTEVRDAMQDALALMGDADDDEILQAIQTDPKYATVRRLVGGVKSGGVADMVDDMLDDDPNAKVIVFAHHRDVIADLDLRLGDHHPLVIHGGVSQPNRELAIKLFQETPRHRLIIIGIEAAGEAITLTAASNVIVAEPSPVPARNAQAIARAHRIGQKLPVVARFVVLPGEFDRRLMSILARKTRDILSIVDPDLVPRKTTLFPQENPV